MAYRSSNAQNANIPNATATNNSMPPILEENGLPVKPSRFSSLNEVLSLDVLPDQLDSQEALQLANQIGTFNEDLNFDELPEELNTGQAQLILNRFRTIGRSTPEPGISRPGKSVGATHGFFGPLPTIRGGVITQGFGTPVNYEKSGKHGGVDIAAPIGTPVPSVEDGEVIGVESNKGGFGKSIVIRNADGSLSRYSHLNDFRVKQGQKIRRGDIIGGVGNTGYVIKSKGGTGSHLDYRRTK